MGRRKDQSDNLPAGLYRRPATTALWFWYYDETGKRQRVSSETDNVDEAAKVRRAVLRKVEARKDSGVTAETGPLTVRRYSETWVADRRVSEVLTVNDEAARLRDHILPAEVGVGLVLGDMRLDTVRRPHVVRMVKGLVGKMKRGELAARTVHHIYGVLRAMYRSALEEEVVDVTPCTLRTKPTELPDKEQDDETWRDAAYYSHEECEALISDVRIPLYRRVLYAICIFTGCRIGEAAALHWSEYDPRIEPLGQLTLSKSYSTKRKVIGKTKTKKVKYAPAHPVLARILAEWKLSGWAQTMGRAPTAEDLVVPSPGAGKWRIKKGGPLSTTSSLKRLHEDLEKIGLRVRGQHDFRRTFMTLGTADGADERWLTFVCWGPPNLKAGGDMAVRYRIKHWPSICQSVAMLKIGARQRGGPGGVVTALSQGVETT